jgi:hypothetical protein
MLKMTYSIEIDKDAYKYLQKLEKPSQVRITNHLQLLCEDPFHPELDYRSVIHVIDPPLDSSYLRGDRFVCLIFYFEYFGREYGVGI